MTTDREHGFYHILIRVVLIGAAVGTVIALFSRSIWLAELFSHFRLYYLLALLLLALTFLWTNHPYLLVLSLALALPNAWYVVPYLSPLAKTAEAAVVRPPPFSIVAHNLKFSNNAHATTLEYLRASDADVLLLAEYTSQWAAALAPLDAIYPYRRLQPRPHPWGLAIYSRTPFEQIDEFSLGPGDNVQFQARLMVDEQPVELFAVHLFSPVKPSLARGRNQQLRELAVRVRNAGAPALVVGDMNVTPFSPYFGDFLRDAGLEDARRRSGFHITWPTFPVPLWIPIDHCLASPQLQIVDVENGPDVGSDHYPLEVRLLGVKTAGSG